MNNWLLMRFDCAKFLTFYRRITPDAVEDIGIYQSIFEMLNVVGAVSTTAIVVYRSPILGKGGRASQQSQDAVFIGVVTGFFCVIKLLECCIDDVHHDVARGVSLSCHTRVKRYQTQVALQIERQEFIQRGVGVRPSRRRRGDSPAGVRAGPRSSTASPTRTTTSSSRR